MHGGKQKLQKPYIINPTVKQCSIDKRGTKINRLKSQLQSLNIYLKLDI